MVSFLTCASDIYCVVFVIREKNYDGRNGRKNKSKNEIIYFFNSLMRRWGFIFVIDVGSLNNGGKCPVNISGLLADFRNDNINAYVCVGNCDISGGVICPIMAEFWGGGTTAQNPPLLL